MLLVKAVGKAGGRSGFGWGTGVAYKIGAKEETRVLKRDIVEDWWLTGCKDARLEAGCSYEGHGEWRTRQISNLRLEVVALRNSSVALLFLSG